MEKQPQFKQAILTSLDPKKYPNRTIDCQVMENPAKELPNFVDTTKTVMAEKRCVVTARKAKLGETIKTGPLVQMDGKKYRFDEVSREVTQKDVDNGAMVVRNPDGELYIVTAEKFVQQYGNIAGDGTAVEPYEASGAAKPFQKATESFCIPKPTWGEGVYQYVLKGSMVNVEKVGNPTGVTNVAFDGTYQVAKTAEIDQKGV